MLQVERIEFDAIANGLWEMLEMVVWNVAGSEACESTDPGGELGDLVLAQRQRRDVLRRRKRKRKRKRTKMEEEEEEEEEEKEEEEEEEEEERLGWSAVSLYLQ